MGKVTIQLSLILADLKKKNTPTFHVVFFIYFTTLLN